MAEQRQRIAFDLKTILAFAAIYILWGSTFLAIRILVETVPVFLAAGARFAIAGLLLFAWMRLRGAPTLTSLEWRNATLLGVLLFLGPYAGLFWAEKTVPSGVASVLVATIPLWTVLLETLIFKAQRSRPEQLAAIAFGFFGVLVVARGTHDSTGRFALLPCLALLGSTLSWSFGTVLSRSLALPASKAMSSGAQMLCGGGLLLLFSLMAHELRPAPQVTLPAAIALIYLISAGSIAGFTAYTWLLGRMSATKVASYAYVNPIVALSLGHELGGEAISWQTLVGSAIIVASVILLLGYEGERSAPRSASDRETDLSNAGVNGTLSK